MKRKEIIIITSAQDADRVKSILHNIKLNNPEFIFSAPVRGRIGDIILLTIKVVIDSHEELYSQIRARNLKIFSKEEFFKKHTPTPIEPENKYIKSNEVKITTNSKLQIFDKKLDDYVKEGNYRAVIKISKDVNSDRKLAEKAKSLISPLIEELIEYLYSKSIIRSFFAEEGINKLLQIASDKSLKPLGYQNFMKSASLYAINLCAIYDSNIYKLIAVTNDIIIPQDVCIKAASMFGKVTLNDPEKFSIEITQAEKKMNYRWLETIYEGVSNSITEDEKRYYEKLKRHIKKSRI